MTNKPNDIRDRFMDVTLEQAQDFCGRVFDELWEEEPLAGDRYYKIELEKKRMQKMILDVLRLELVKKKPPIENLTPAYFEYKFEALSLKTETRELRLTGKIDRIDVDASGKFALVIDYKTGKPFKASSLENGTSLQLPIYLMAVREKLGLKPLGGHLYSLSRATSTGFHHKGHLTEAGVSTRKGSKLSEKEFEDLLKNAIRYAEQFAGGIERAEIPVRPRDCVDFCPYSAVCRIEKWRLEHLYRDIEEEDKELLREKAET